MRKKKILLVDPDLQLLTYALGSLREAGYDVISESDATKAMDLAGRWCPHLVIAPSRTLAAWQQAGPKGTQALPPGSALLVTAQADEPDQQWRNWVDQGHEILLKPIVHYHELHAAIESAMRAAPKQQNPSA